MPTEAAPDEGGTAVPAEAPEGEEPAPAPEAVPSTLPPAPEGIPQPGDMNQMLNELGPPQQPTDFTAPTPVLTLHGYLRVRGELMDTFWLGRDTLDHFRQLVMGNASDDLPLDAANGQGPDPFSRFRPAEARPQVAADPTAVDCVDEDTSGDHCDVSTLQFANMRLRLSPELALSEEVRVNATFDVLDNIVLGESPQPFYGAGSGRFGVYTGTQDPNLFEDSIKARRAWAVVSNSDIGELRFGRMGQEWGLGMVYNAGNGFDDDVSTDVDSVRGIVNLAGIRISAAYDFGAEGVSDFAGAQPIDQSQLDDLDQFTFAVYRQSKPEELAAAKEKGQLVLNGGLQLQIRNQDATYDLPAGTAAVSPLELARRGWPGTITEISATTYTPDLWGVLRYRGLRIEAEVALVHGTMNDPTDGVGTYDIDQFGYALETELKLFDDKLGLYIDHGLATGDGDVEGLSSDADFISQQGLHNDGTVSTFRFHPNYRVDLILWRNIMQQVTGAFYIKPGISYDFIRSDWGQLLGARLDVVWSRATSFVQTWGNDPDLGLELDLSLYYRTEDGPELEDGFFAKMQYGVLFPMRGLGFRHEDTDLETAQTLRLMLGVVY